MKRIERKLNEDELYKGRLIILEVSYSKEGDKFYKISANSSGTAWFKEEIDPHRELFEDNYHGVIVERKDDITDDDDVISVIGVANIAKVDAHDPEILYKETFNGETKALLKGGIAC